MDSGSESYRKYLSGDDTGLYEIVCSYRDGLILYLNSIVRDIDLAEDLAEDTFVRLLLKKPADHTEKASFKTWLYTIGRNIALDYFRNNRGRVCENIDDLTEITGDEAELCKNLILEERKKIVYQAMKKLKQDQQQVLWLKYFEGLSSRETAKVMRKTVRNVDTLASRARQALKKELENGGYSYEDL